MFITAINDCSDANALGRISTRVSSLWNIPATCIGVGAYGELAAAGNLIDALDAARGQEGAILVNVAPRHSDHRWPNGTPFAYFYVQKTLVVCTVEGLTLSLVKKIHLTEAVQLTDIPSVVRHMEATEFIDPRHAENMMHGQFRSLEYQPYLASYLMQGKKPPSISMPITDIQDAPPAIWWVDNFGNCKTTMLMSDVAPMTESYTTRFGDLPIVERMVDAPKGELALIAGSSGFEDRRFLEIIIGGGSAAEKLGVKAGDTLA